MGVILLEGMEFYAYHGYYDHEREKGNYFTVDLKVNADLSKAAVTDNLDDTLDYGVFYEVIKKEMEIPSKLLEHVAGRILEKLSTDTKAEEIEITISKKNPPVSGKATRSAVTLTYKKRP